MSFLDVIKRNGKGIPQPVTESPMANALAQPTPAAPASAPATTSSGFTLPELDPNDPDYEEKSKIHAAFLALDKHLTENVPNVDFQKQYQDIQNEMAKAPQERHISPLRKFAIALGTQDPEQPYAPNRGLAQVEETAQKQHAGAMSEFEKTLDLKREAMTGHIQQLMQQGEFRKALAMANTKAQNDITAARAKDTREHSNKMEEIKATVAGRADVARIAAQGAMDRAEARIAAVKANTSNLKLSPTDKAQMTGEIDLATQKFRIATARDPLTGEVPDPDVIDQAEDTHRRELVRIHNFYEDREIGTRPANAGPVKEVVKRNTRPSGAAWQAAGQ
jgi:hypothetical protein